MTDTLSSKEISEPIEISHDDPKIIEGLNSSPVYRKNVDVKVAFASGGEKVFTKLADGSIETENTASEGDAIVTNEGGERHIIRKDDFIKLYDPVENKPGVFRKKVLNKAADNPWHQSVTMLASWGQMQNGGSDCKFVDTYDPNTNTLGGNPYIVGRKEFENTYVIAEKPTSPNE